LGRFVYRKSSHFLLAGLTWLPYVISFSFSAPAAKDTPMSEGSGPSEPALVLCPERLAVEAGGQVLRLTATQFRILTVLMSEPGRVFSRKELVERGMQTVVEERTVDVHLKELRRKLGPYAARLETVRYQGYRYMTSMGQTEAGP
jgi:DNA-binding response OmpR family regulator